MSQEVSVPKIPDTTTVTIVSSQTEEAIGAIVEQACLLPSALARPTDAIMCRSIMNQAGQLATAIDKQRKAISDPFEKAKKAIIAAAKEPLETLEQVVAGCKELLAVYQVTVEAENAKADRARQAMEAEAPLEGRPTAALVLDAPEQKPLDVVPTTTVRDLEIIDEALVPMKYRPIDRVSLRRDVLAGVEVPGCRVRVDKVISNR